ncbi:GNAT family N-acetyltransferase [Deinococcus cavernae]|uniref:GNAT family N-acetyltransferase n=1 Tax=Deinococcus cavernae TaxID=2320857 RepID=UPI001F1DDEFA|nr:GNAT family N-acetyltransferase [Deinococcus cavernae]
MSHRKPRRLAGDSDGLQLFFTSGHNARVSVTVRPAQVFDAGFAAPLIQQTIGAIGQALTGSASDDEAAHVIAQFFPLRGHRLSFTQTLIAELDGRPAGLAVLYPGEFAVPLDQPFRDFLKSRGLPDQVVSEGLPGELYLDTLATLPDVRGQGVGTALLRACSEKARQQSLPLGLLVEEGNPAQRLYVRHGFVAAGQTQLAGHRYLRLRQPLPEL